jgi:hypothetical protein
VIFKGDAFRDQSLAGWQFVAGRGEELELLLIADNEDDIIKLLRRFEGARARIGRLCIKSRRGEGYRAKDKSLRIYERCRLGSRAHFKDHGRS